MTNGAEMAGAPRPLECRRGEGFSQAPRSWARLCLAIVLTWIPGGARAEHPGPEELRGRIREIASAAQGRVGAAVMLLETGESVSFCGEERFPMQSVYKFPIAMAVLHQVDAGALTLGQVVTVGPEDFLSDRQHSPIRDQNPHGVALTLEALLQAMVQESDGTACDVLLRLVDGPTPVAGYLRNIGVQDLVVATTEREMGADEQVQYRNWTTPRAMVALLRVLHEGDGVSATSRTRLLRWMTDTTTGRRRLKGHLPPGTIVAHKTGSSRTFDGLTRATNDAGIVALPDGRHLAIAVFVADSKADDATRDDVIAQIARVAWDYWAARG